jgi:secretion/DNA translocation related CpaE-like protein
MGHADAGPVQAGGPGDVLVVTETPELAQTLAGLVRGAGGRPVVVPSGEARDRWQHAALVLAQWPLEEWPLEASRTGPSGGARHGLVLVCAAEPGSDVWRDAVTLGAEHVAVLPDAEPWLAARISRAVAARGAAPVLAVVGGRGGAGASTLAVAVAVTAARRDLEVTLLDVDPLGGGLDLVLGAESAPGLRWPDLRNAPGRLPPGIVKATAARVEGVSLVGWERSTPAEVSPQAVGAVLRCAAEDADLVVADLPRHVDDVGKVVLGAARRVLVVVPAEVRAAASAARVVAALEPYAADVALVVRGPAPTGLPAEAVADSLGLPLAGELRAEPGLAAALDRGDVPPIRARGPLSALAARLVAASLAT